MKASIPQAGDRLIHDAVHEFQTPLTVIREFASILAEGLCAPGVVTQEECVRAIHGASGDLMDMFDSFRGVATARWEGLPVAQTPCTLSEIWEESLPAIARRAAEHGVELEADVDAATATIEVDRKLVGHALRCIVRSAIRTTATGGRVRCWIRRRSHAHVAFGCLGAGPELSPEDVRLFEQGDLGKGFERRSRICTFGLDLEFARVVAAANRGHLRLRAGAGGDRACLLYLPVANAAGVTPTERLRHRAMPQRSSR